MTRVHGPQSAEFVFRLHPLWFLIETFLIFCIGMSFIAAAIRFDQPVWFVGMAITAVIGALLTSHYNTQAIIIRGTLLTCRSGVLTVREHTLSVVQVHVETEKPLLGRLLGYGTVRLHLDGQRIEFHRIARPSDLQMVVAYLQNQLLLQMTSMQVIERQLGRDRAAYVMVGDRGWRRP